MADIDWYIEILTEGELIDTREGFTYEDEGYTKNEDGTYKFYYKRYGYRPTDGWEEIDDPSDIERLTKLVESK